jgi:hypothetical protein
MVNEMREGEEKSCKTINENKNLHKIQIIFNNASKQDMLDHPV